MEGKGYYIVQGAIIGMLALLSVSVTGCDAIFGIFKAGFWTGIILLVVLMIGILLVARMIKK